MQIDSNRIRTERERRAWSQEHLAEVAGLSLRTVQRVETTGAASFETARALAAVIETEVSALRVQAMPPTAFGARMRYAGLAAALVLALGVFLIRDARAGDGTEGTVKLTSPKGNVIEIAIRPRRM